MLCDYCGELITEERRARSPLTVTCSHECTTERDKILNPNTGAALGIARSTVGPLAEMMVAVDLMRKGYYVFRAVSYHCPCDLVVLQDTTVVTIEVRTAYKSRTTTTISGNRKIRADIWAGVLLVENEIIYEPPLEEFFKSAED